MIFVCSFGSILHPQKRQQALNKMDQRSVKHKAKGKGQEDDLTLNAGVGGRDSG